jgi:hypothetical protein
VAVAGGNVLYDADHEALLQRLAREGQLSTAAVDFTSTGEDRFIGLA